MPGEAVGVVAQRGRGPYPGIVCCYCFEVLCGMKFLAWLSVIDAVCIVIVYAYLAHSYQAATLDPKVM